jgi:hypothetical protein
MYQILQCLFIPRLLALAHCGDHGRVTLVPPEPPNVWDSVVYRAIVQSDRVGANRSGGKKEGVPRVQYRTGSDVEGEQLRMPQRRSFRGRSQYIEVIQENGAYITGVG